MAPASRVPERRKSEPDESLLVEAAQKDPRQFAGLYENNFHRVYAYVVRRVGDRAAAEDLTSAVFHKALANLKGFEWRGTPFIAWLYRIAANAIADHAQRVARERNVPPGNDPADPGEPAPEEIEQRGRVFACVAKLPTDQRRVILLRFAEEKSIREIAQELRRSEGAIKQLQFRGLQQLRSLVGKANE